MRLSLLSLLKDGNLLGFARSTTPNEAEALLKYVPNTGKPSKDILLQQYENLELTFIRRGLQSAMINFTREKIFCQLEEFDLPNRVLYDSLIHLVKRNNLAFTLDDRVIPSGDAIRVIFPSGAYVIVHEDVVTRAYYNFTHD